MSRNFRPDPGLHDYIRKYHRFPRGWPFFRTRLIIALILVLIHLTAWLLFLLAMSPPYRNPGEVLIMILGFGGTLVSIVLLFRYSRSLSFQLIPTQGSEEDIRQKVKTLLGQKRIAFHEEDGVIFLKSRPRPDNDNAREIVLLVPVPQGLLVNHILNHSLITHVGWPNRYQVHYLRFLRELNQDLNAGSGISH